MLTGKTKTPPSVFGVRTSIWEVACVLLFAGLGAWLGGSLYCAEVVFGAFFGAACGPGIVRWLSTLSLRLASSSEKMKRMRL